ncbi:MAG TPA: hypothetical protein VEJ39_08920 [Candidatus Acidoferrales bacterium]|nr:hypothetical protein [Candidatus Acidoferrales bacterium]
MQILRNIAFCSWAIIGFALPAAAQVQPHVSPPSHDMTPPASAPQSDAPPAPAPAATPESTEKGKAIVLAGARAAGGEALSNLKSVEIASSGQADTPGGMMDITLKLTIVYPNQLRSDAHLPIADISQGFDGTSGWVLAPQGVLDLPPEYKGEIDRGIALAGAWGLYRDALAGGISVQYLDDEDLDGKKMEAVQWNATNGPVKLYFDPSTHLLAAAHFRSITPQGPAQTDQRWSDYRAEGGLQYPHHSVIFRDGSKFSDTKVDSVKLNTNPDPKMFAKPASAPEPAPSQQ